LPLASAGLIRRHLAAPVAAMAFTLAIATVTAAVAGGDPGLALGVGAVVFGPGRGADLRGGGQRHQRPLRVRPHPAAGAGLEPCPYRGRHDRRVPAAVHRLEGRRRRRARVSGVFGGDLVLIFFALVGFAGLTYRFEQREKAAM